VLHVRLSAVVNEPADPHYFNAAPSVASARREVTVQLPDGPLHFTTDRGVFSNGRLDAGTAVLLREAGPLPESGDLLDLGCGAGPIALTMARRRPTSTVWAVDVNERAVELCAANAAALGLGNVRAVAPDLVPADVALAAIWSNPPIRIGKDALHDLLLSWLPRLGSGGVATLVVNRNLGADSLAGWLGQQGYAVARLASRKGYRLLDVRRPAEGRG
jgi:16S rRNA (guanine1207-N2)-methyltransferase